MRTAPTFAALFFAAASLLGATVVHADAYTDVQQQLRTGKNEEALSSAEKYISGNTRDPQMRFLKGVAQSALGRIDDAQDTFLQLTMEYPELPEPYNNLAVIYAGKNELEKARAALDTAVRNNPNYATAHENLGDIYVRMAQASYQQAQKLDVRNKTITPKLTQLRSVLTMQPPAPAAAATKP